ncbi:hypothetical protein CA951_18015 [Rhodococcus sp. NCIMB 12038]|nr:hypothetical protein CA951_18015 [Rhodococcus sp. NCIMB 12038]
MSTRGVVREWNDHDLFGVIDSPETPGGCWVIWSTVAVRHPETGKRELIVGQEVDFDWETSG